MLFVFAMGNVVIKGIDIIDQTVKLLGIDSEEFVCDYMHYVFPLMEGTVSVESYYRHLEQVFGVKVPGNPARDFFKPDINLPVTEIIDELHRRGERVICASNTYEPHWSVIKEEKLDRFFDFSYPSHEIGLSKPSAAYFEYIRQKEGVEFSDMLFMDDYEENIVAASKLGIKTFWYKEGYDDSKLFDSYFNLIAK